MTQFLNAPPAVTGQAATGLAAFVEGFTNSRDRQRQIQAEKEKAQMEKERLGLKRKQVGLEKTRTEADVRYKQALGEKLGVDAQVAKQSAATREKEATARLKTLGAQGKAASKSAEKDELAARERRLKLAEELVQRGDYMTAAREYGKATGQDARYDKDEDVFVVKDKQTGDEIRITPAMMQKGPPKVDVIQTKDGPVSRGQLYKEWKAQAFTKNDLGNEVPAPGAPTWEDFVEGQKAIPSLSWFVRKKMEDPRWRQQGRTIEDAKAAWRHIYKGDPKPTFAKAKPNKEPPGLDTTVRTGRQGATRTSKPNYAPGHKERLRELYKKGASREDVMRFQAEELRRMRARDQKAEIIDTMKEAAMRLQAGSLTPDEAAQYLDMLEQADSDLLTPADRHLAAPIIKQLMDYLNQ